MAEINHNELMSLKNASDALRKAAVYTNRESNAALYQKLYDQIDDTVAQLETAENRIDSERDVAIVSKISAACELHGRAKTEAIRAIIDDIRKAAAVDAARRPADVKALEYAITAFIYRENMHIDVNFYTPAVWRSRRETVGLDAALNMTFEGAFYRFINVDGSKKLIAEFDALVAGFNFRTETGYGWSMHFYPKDKADADSKVKQQEPTLDGQSS